jgi:predicted secreted protein
LSKRNKRHDILVRCGEQFKIELESNSSTGYRWQPLSFDQSMLKLVCSEFLPNIKNQVGSAGIQRFNFQASKKGTTSIKLVYKRAWEVSTMKSNEFSVKVL